MSFRLKVILGVALIEVVLLAALVTSSLHYLVSSNETQFRERAQTSVQLLATMTTDALVAMDLATLDSLVEESLKNAEIAFVRVSTRNGRVLSQGGDVGALSHDVIPGTDEDTTRGWIKVSHPVEVSGSVFGQIDLGIRTGQLDATLADASQWMLLVALTEILLVAVFGYVLGRILTRQLTDIQEGARAIAEGHLGRQISVRGRDELAETARYFNQMSGALATYAMSLDEARQQAEDRREMAESTLHDAITSLSEGIVIIGPNNEILQANAAFGDQHQDVRISELQYVEELNERLLPSITLEQMGSPTFEELPEDLTANTVRGLANADEESQWTAHFVSDRVILYSASSMKNGGRVLVTSDISSIVEAEARARRLERELLQSQKLEAVGTLAGGIAHELNTPIQFIGDNLEFVSDSTANLIDIAKKHQSLLEQLANSTPIDGSTLEDMKRGIEDADFEFLQDEVPNALEQSVDGMKQMATIVRAMKEFSHPSAKEKGPVDVNAVLERASIVAKSEWKYLADVHWKLADPAPLALVNESDLNQVLLNLIVNAAHAIKEAGRGQGVITLTSERCGDSVRIEVRDNGTGIPDEIRDRVYEQFFTTKDVGQGTGQGLSICREFIVNQNNGQLDFETEMGRGTAFIIELPCAGERDLAA